MRGLLFKKIKQNWIALLMSFLFPAIICFLSLLLSGTEETEDFSLTRACEVFGINGTLTRILYCGFVYFTLGSLQANVLVADENKKWGYFVASTPKGKEGQMYSNYLIIFMMCGLTYISYIIIETALGVLTYHLTGEICTSIVGITSFMLYVQLFLRAIELPSLVRFGTKIGGHLRAIVLALLVVGVGVYLLFGPLPTDSGTLAESIFSFIEDFTNGLIPDWLLFMQSIFPVIAVGGFILSWFISSNFYLKGVENYDK